MSPLTGNPNRCIPSIIHQHPDFVRSFDQRAAMIAQVLQNRLNIYELQDLVVLNHRPDDSGLPGFSTNSFAKNFRKASESAPPTTVPFVGMEMKTTLFIVRLFVRGIARDYLTEPREHRYGADTPRRPAAIQEHRQKLTSHSGLSR